MYMAPERIRGLDGIDARSDVFAAAVILYEMMAGVCPFADSTPSASLAAVLERQVDPDPRIEPRLWLEIRRAMAKAQYERHATAREFCDALKEAVGGTEKPLEASLKIQPAADWDDATEAGADVQALASTATNRSRPAQVSRRRATWTVWAVAGALAGVVLSCAILVVRAMAARTNTANGGAEIVSPSQVREPPHAPALSPGVGAVPSVLPSPSTVISTASPPRPDAVQPAPSGHAKRPPSAEGRPRPIATTPGF
jgi:serine/threonine-protein kinase